MFQFEFKAIGTEWFLDLDIDSKLHHLHEIQKRVESLCFDFEQKYSRFIDTSEVGILNLNKTLKSPSSHLKKMIQIAEDLRVLTNGSFDIRVGEVLNKLGYDSKYSFKNSLNETPLNDFSKIIIEKDKIEIGEHSSIDLGGIGKGYLIDKVSQFLKDLQINHFTINAGGDIFSNMKNGATFLLESPFEPKKAVGEIRIKDRAIACSSSNRRRWTNSKGNGTLHHLIDMNREVPIDKLASLFTYAKSALNADLASTALYVSSIKLWSLIASKLDIEFLAIFADGSYLASENYPGRMYT